MKKTYTYVSRRGSKILCRGFYENGERYLDKVDYEPTLFISGKKTNEKPWHDIYGNKVYPVKPGSISDCKDFLDRYKDVEGFNVLGMTNWVSQYLSDEYNYEIHPDFNHTRVYTIDIETEIIDSFPDPSKANEEILLITVHDTLHDRYLVYGANKVNQEKVFGILEENGLSKDKVKFIITQDEYSMLKQFVIDWSNQYPDAITGWNTETFDIPFLVNRINRVLGEEFVKKLSPFGIVTERFIKRNNNEEQIYDIEGIAKLDYLDLMKKYTYGDRESWKLGDVAQDELGKTKLDFDCSFIESYQKYWDRFVAYNIIDVHLVEELDKKFKLIELAYTVAYMAKINPDEIFSPIRTWDSIIFNHLKSKGIVVPEQKRHKLENSIAGGFVKDPQMGKHEWIVSFDFASLYPSLMMFNNISPDTLIGDFFRNVKMDRLLSKDYDLDYLKQDEVCMTANGVGFTKTKKGFVPELVEGYYDLRKKTKKEMLKLEQEYADTKNEKLVPQISSLNAKQMAVKILMNSLFGAMASPYFRFFDTRMAEGITLTGQLAIQWTANEINNFLNKACQTQNKDYIIYCVDGSTEIYVNGKKIKIAEFYEQCNTTETVVNNKRIKKIAPFGYKTKSFNVKDKTIEEDKTITNVIKSKVKKKMYKVKCKGKEIICSEDHRILVSRDGNIIEVFPDQLQKTDLLITVKN